MSVPSSSERNKDDSPSSCGETSRHPYFHLKQFSSQPQSIQDRIEFTLSHMEPLDESQSADQRLVQQSDAQPLRATCAVAVATNQSFSDIPDTVCVHPVSFHSFTSPSTLSFTNLISSKFKTCSICLEKLSGWSNGWSGVGGTLGGDLIGGNTASIVTCLACGMYAHRSCALANSCEMQEDNMGARSRVKVCPVNLKLLEGRLLACQQHCTSKEVIPAKETKDVVLVEDRDKGGTTDLQNKRKPLGLASSGPISPPPVAMFSTPLTNTDTDVLQCENDDDDSDNDDTWSVSGPPAHWALSSPEALKGIKLNAKEMESPLQDVEEQQNWFLSLSKALQQNIGRTKQSDDEEKEDAENSLLQDEETVLLSGISQTSNGEGENNDEEEYDDDDDERETHVKDKSTKVVSNILKLKQSCSNDESNGMESDENDDQDSASNNETNEGMKSLLVTKEPRPTLKKQNTFRKGASDAISIAKKTNSTSKNIGFASIAGGVAGGVVGLVFAGPAGVYIGAKIGQVVGVAGAVVEGSIGVGVLVAGVTGTVLTVNQLKEENQRMITIGENGTDCKVVLVRPNVMIDPVWDDITNRARFSAPADKNGLAALIDNQKIEKKKRRKRDEEILQSEDNELSTKEKILLLVSSSLNDKRSLPGHIYRELIQEHQLRFGSRRIQKNKDDSNDDPRITRQDTHAVIKHVTATLLEVRPGFSASPRITEISATAVETMVFGRVFDCVMQEIREETKEKDGTLIQNIEDCQGQITSEVYDKVISSKAIHAIQMIPTCYSVAEKLRCCVTLLETISDQCSDVNADNLLKMVCQHLVFARVSALNAEIVFLEEFARDEQLLRGKEGYALVTMQASLHFMNASTNFIADIFEEHRE